VLVRVTLGALGLLPAGCGFGGPGQITLGYLTWHANVAVSNLTKVLLEGDLGYENVELRRAEDVVPAYKMVGSAEADAFQDTWMPNQREALSMVEDDEELLDPWFKGTTRFSVREDPTEDYPVAYAFMDSMELTEAEVTGPQTAIEEAGDPVEGAKTWLEENRDVVEAWVEAAEKAREG
jgi:ABC-type proline/glycine betaine transport system substrate-binding protein